MTIQIYPKFLPKIRTASRMLRAHSDQDPARILNGLDKNHWPEDGDEMSHNVIERLGIKPRFSLPEMTAVEMAEMLENIDPRIMANYHATMATSIWSYYGQPRRYHPDLFRELDREARRNVWIGTPYIPAARWDFQDGSALVSIGSSISAAVHRDRIDLITDQYMEAAQKSLNRTTLRARTKGYQSGRIPIVPNTAFAPANDGLLNHKAALPDNREDCWCDYSHANLKNINKIDV